MARFAETLHQFKSGDGTSLFYRAWRPSVASGKLLVLFHRGHEHSGRWEDVIEALAPEGFTVFAWDARGNGRSEGPRDDAENFGCYARDAELFVRYLSATESVPMDRIAVVGHSVGAAVVAAENVPASLDVVTLDERLAAAARREGFRVKENDEGAS